MKRQQLEQAQPERQQLEQAQPALSAEDNNIEQSRFFLLEPVAEKIGVI